jgi:hypothetical protein
VVLALAVSAGAMSVGVVSACAPPPVALDAPFTCGEWLAADEWSRILTLMTYLPQAELRELAAPDGAIDWDGVLAVADESCTGDPDLVVDVDGPWTDLLT